MVSDEGALEPRALSFAASSRPPPFVCARELISVPLLAGLGAGAASGHRSQTRGASFAFGRSIGQVACVWRRCNSVVAQSRRHRPRAHVSSAGPGGLLAKAAMDWGPVGACARAQLLPSSAAQVNCCGSGSCLTSGRVFCLLVGGRPRRSSASRRKGPTWPTWVAAVRAALAPVRPPVSTRQPAAKSRGGKIQFQTNLFASMGARPI